MRVTVFFVFLLSLLKGYDHIYTATHQHNTARTPAQIIQKKQQVSFTGVNGDHTIYKGTTLSKQEEFLVFEDVEDEDASSFSRKYRLLTKWCLTLSYLFILRYLYKCVKARLTFCGPLFYRYIIQGVLRI